MCTQGRINYNADCNAFFTFLAIFDGEQHNKNQLTIFMR